MIELPINPAASLVDLNFVRLVRRIDTEEISAQIDCGKLIFVWDVSATCAMRKRQLRFYLPEVVSPQFTARLRHDEVMQKILPPTRQNFFAAEVGNLLLLSRNSLAALARQLEARLIDRTFKFSRESLVTWLTSRWLGKGAQ